MKALFRPNRYRSIALLLTGVLPLVVQPGALAGQIAASRYVDKVVADLPLTISVDDLLRMLDESAEGESGTDRESLPEDVVSVIIQCRLFSLISDSVILQASDVDHTSILSGHVVDRPVFFERGRLAPTVLLPTRTGTPKTRRLSDEQPLGP